MAVKGKDVVTSGKEYLHHETPTDVGIRAATSDVAVAVVTLKAGDFTQDRLSLILVKCEGGWRSRMVTIR
jgi:hypothetical protein